MQKIVLLFLLLFTSAKLYSECDHLQPVDIKYDISVEYHNQIDSLLLPGMSDKPLLRLLVTPAFTPEFIMQIEYDGTQSKYFMVFHICDSSIWYSKNRMTLKVNRTRKEIADSSAELISELFQKAVNQTRDCRENFGGLDGVSYYFTAGPDLKSGYIWSPSKGGRMYDLIIIGCDLVALMENDKDKVVLDSELTKAIMELIARLND